jgi:hypothetical protein
MPANFCLPEHLKVVECTAPQVGAAAAITGAYLDIAQVQMVWVVVHYAQADGTSITWRVNKATALVGTGATALTVVQPIWSNLDQATSDLLVRQTDAVSYASGTGATHKTIIFQVDPSSLGATFNFISGGSTTAIAAGQYVSIDYYVLPRYPSRVLTAPTLVT